jgi:VCBS repeat-containing protein
MNTSTGFTRRTSLARPALLLSLFSTLLLSACGSDDSPMMVVNKPPAAENLTLSTQTETAVTAQIVATDPENDALSFTLLSEPSLGAISLQPSGAFTYTPANEVTGMDSFTVAVSDGVNGAVIALVGININAQQLMFSNLSRQAFLQSSDSEPLRLNGRVIDKDVSSIDFYDDLLLD